MDNIIYKIAGKKYKSLIDIKHVFNNFKVRHISFKLLLSHHTKFCNYIFFFFFGLTNVPAILYEYANYISTIYNHLLNN